MPSSFPFPMGIPLVRVSSTTPEAVGWEIWIPSFEAPILLANLGLSARAESPGDIFPTLIGDGSTWETPPFEIFSPSGINSLEVVPLWGANSIAGYDNIVTPGEIQAGFTGFPRVGALTGFNDDPDKDGQANRLKNFLGTDPSASSQGLIVGSVDPGIQTIIFYSLTK